MINEFLQRFVRIVDRLKADGLRNLLVTDSSLIRQRAANNQATRGFGPKQYEYL